MTLFSVRSNRFIQALRQSDGEHKQEEEENKQLKIIDKITDKALKQVELERKNKSRNYIVEWFRYAELVSKGLNKYLN